MKKFKNLVFYILIIGGFTYLIFFIINFGSHLEIGKNIILPSSKNTQWGEFLNSMMHNIKHPLAILLAQIITIIFVARLFGWIFKKIGQPSVIGEIIAGIVLGPSLIGMYFPEFSLALFPKESLGNLQFLSQIGLILFMFVIGMELDLKVLKNKAHEAVVISHASIVFPFALGIGLAYFLYDKFAPEGIQFLAFSLFLGIAMSITAFPVLARIVQERGLNKTKLGTIVITCAAADDITAWCILAVVIAIVKAGSVISAFYIVLAAVLYVLFMLKIVRPFLKRIGDLNENQANLSKAVIAIFLLTLIISSYLTEIIGIHALFGAFMAGAIMPDSTKFRKIFIEKVEDVSLILLLPLFFVFTGLRTQIGLLNDVSLWQITGIVIAVSVTGKFVGSALAAKFVGQNWKDSLSIGALMNTRGLMELVVLNIGYDLGVLTPEIFAMFVIMALVTTFMTGPSLDLIEWLFRKKKVEIPSEIAQISKYKILISFGNPQKGSNLLKLANSLVKKNKENSEITALHIAQTDVVHQYDTDYQGEIFSPILAASKELDQKVTTLFKAGVDIDNEIVDLANKGDYDLLLVGIGRSIFEGSLLGKFLGFTTRIINPDRIINKLSGKEKLFEHSPFDDRTHQILMETTIPVAILGDKSFEKLDQIALIINQEEDFYLLEYVQKLIYNNGSQILLVDKNDLLNTNPQYKEQIRAIELNVPNNIAITNNINHISYPYGSQDLIILDAKYWIELLQSDDFDINRLPSVLIFRN
ncbi:MAG: cation:proton antiporter [Bacteroidota bacterium]